MNRRHLIVAIVLVICATTAILYPDVLRFGLSPEWGGFESHYKDESRSWLGRVLGAVAVPYAAILIVTLFGSSMTRKEATIHLCLWAMAPPIWFMFEWFVWFDNHPNKNAVDRLLVSQELSRNLWAAVLAVLLAHRLAETAGKTADSAESD